MIGIPISLTPITTTSSNYYMIPLKLPNSGSYSGLKKIEQAIEKLRRGSVDYIEKLRKETFIDMTSRLTFFVHEVLAFLAPSCTW